MWNNDDLKKAIDSTLINQFGLMGFIRYGTASEFRWMITDLGKEMYDFFYFKDGKEERTMEEQLEYLFS